MKLNPVAAVDGTEYEIRAALGFVNAGCDSNPKTRPTTTVSATRNKLNWDHVEPHVAVSHVVQHTGQIARIG